MLIYAHYQFKIFRVKRSVSDSYIVRKNNGQKSASESSKMREKQILGPKEPPRSLKC